MYYMYLKNISNWRIKKDVSRGSHSKLSRNNGANEQYGQCCTFRRAHLKSAAFLTSIRRGTFDSQQITNDSNTHIWWQCCCAGQSLLRVGILPLKRPVEARTLTTCVVAASISQARRCMNVFLLATIDPFIGYIILHGFPTSPNQPAMLSPTSSPACRLNPFSCVPAPFRQSSLLSIACFEPYAFDCYALILETRWA